MYSNPLIKKSLPVYDLTDTVFRIGAQLGITAQFTDPKGQMRTLVNALDGSSVGDVINRVQLVHPDLSSQDIIKGLDILAQYGLLDDKHEYDSIPERYLSNVEYYAAQPSGSSLKAEIAHKTLARTTVALLGLGGGGSNIATLLSGIGFGKVTLVDYDKVELSNLGRQFLYRSSDIGKLKVEAAVAALNDMNPDLKVEGVNKRISSVGDVEAVISDADIVICALDEPPFVAQRRVNKAIVNLNKPCVFGATQLTHGRVFTIIPGNTGCFDCLNLYYSKNDANFVAQFRGFHESGFTPPTIAYGPSIWQIASVMVDECVRLVTNFAEPKTLGHQHEIDYVNYTSFSHPDWSKFDKCPTCGHGRYEDWEIFSYYNEDV
ncbi:ThiF family adenylyltransferase [Canibacter sp. lx-45]|uniref:ThiF family adenylyltransferase n=1 Tax=Canibacter zhuwentaonis TaxID=2837491 RepID=UPI001BDD78C0|nr:ThiF family adenylyltransferase [Canibacter zhuwentaonis]MBT1035331.1 ThiF family adenylyltransferase [Canibacter zhuwentaonis]